ncbi:hypothetical protein K435DRAFT_912027 [Dendrothele bispora CBS 962.96]|uniref:Uncharacterized protein n=1 Tax=Dendrothele bispora (strain CBS 962.96) TaxID=1314807 RepID=A0A4S8LN87_DENBC|nr:hypothetical protein K435DRAFT_912027 [Dendrothele bispora CBS 962.96]
MTANVTFILDDQDLVFVGGSISSNVTNVTEPDTVRYLTPNNTSTLGYIQDSFYQNSLLFFNSTYEMEYETEVDGSSILFFGYALDAEVSKNFTVDGSLVQPNNLSQNSNNSDLPALTGGQFPLSPFQGRISGVQQMSIDYALITATNTSNLEDKTIFVDDDDAEITWSGWTRQADRSYEIAGLKYKNSSGLIEYRDVTQALPHGNSVHQSNTLGDSFIFKFAGKSILVGGYTPGPDQGPIDPLGPRNTLTMTFDVDGNSTLGSYFTPASHTSLHFVYFSNPDLPAGNHTLTATIHSVKGNISAYIDYITYKPIFSTLIDKPDFSDPDPTSISPPDPTPSGNHGSAAVIAGATIGPLLLITILITSLWFFKQRQKREQRLQGIHDGMSGYGCTDPSPYSAFNIVLPSSAMPTSESPAVIAARMRGMEVQMELMSREIQQHIVAPPTYQSEWDS